MASDDNSLADILVIESVKPAILVGDVDLDLARRLNEIFNRASVEDSSLMTSEPEYIIRSATSSADALAIIADSQAKQVCFSLAFVAYRFGSENGLSLVTQLWQQDPTLNVVICTSDPDPDWRQIVDALGESDQLLILKKPFGDLQLRQMVHAMIRQWQLVRESQSVMQFFAQQNQELDAANQKLQEIQTQLLQSEKMSSIGQLAAGVAHEINNPIGFIKSNLNSLKSYSEDLLRLISAYEKAEEAIVSEDTLMNLHSIKQQIDLDYLKSDVLALLAESAEGIERVKKIVQDLKDFSYPDKNADNWQWANLQSGLESTLNIVYNELKYKAEIVKEYAELPEIYCLLSQLNQVFVNLLINAAHAINDHGVITIKTGTEDDKVWVEVADTGSGIPEDKLNKIFDPFYTTKPLGKGTGLGLAISYGIIKKHNGEIVVHSQVGQGTTFRVVLPINPNPTG
jgi:Signal transduction histidine kinase regulating C4-dicarboxylate transport system